MEMITSRLSVRITWLESQGEQPVRTMARIAVLADDQVVWPAWGDPDSALEIYTDDLLSQLAECWQPLMLRQTYPLPVTIDRPSQLRPEAEKSWGTLPEDEVDAQDAVVQAFEDTHNIALSFGGQFELPALWLFRQGSHMLVETSDRLIAADFWQVAKALSDAGNTIAQRLEQIAGDKWAKTIRRWRNRDRGDPDALLAWSTGLPRDSALALREAGALTAASSVGEIARDDDELRIAARMAGALPVREITRLLLRAARVPVCETPELEALSREARGVLTSDIRERMPFEQGVLVAQRIRQHLVLGSFRRADPFLLLRQYGVHVELDRLGLATLDALAVWGARHGPGMLLNLDSRRIASTPRTKAAGHGAVRVTAAHAFCHLLLDREEALGAVDILDGRMPLLVEQRARAFAAAFLLPSEASEQVWSQSGGPRTRDGISKVIRRLTHKYGVTTSVAAWQLEHGLRGQDAEIVFLLDQMSPQRRIAA
jgi:hypothetical protein